AARRRARLRSAAEPAAGHRRGRARRGPVNETSERPAVPLGELLPDAGLTAEQRRIPIYGITADSRAVEPGFLFAALPGVKADGIAFAKSAADKGAAAIVGARAPD